MVVERALSDAHKVETAATMMLCVLMLALLSTAHAVSELKMTKYSPSLVDCGSTVTATVQLSAALFWRTAHPLLGQHALRIKRAAASRGCLCVWRVCGGCVCGVM